MLQDAPFSTKEFDETWKQLCAFEVLGRGWLPTAYALAMLWKSIISIATVRDVNLEKTFDIISLAEAVGNDGYPWALFMAVVTQLTYDTNDLRDQPITPDTILKDMKLNRDKTTRWVGNAFLQVAGKSGIPQSDFLAQWRDVLPEDWRKHVSMDLLKVTFSTSLLLSSSNEDAG